jgi:hypothetical protein
MDSTPRSDWGPDYLRRYYRGTDDLFNKSLDGIIVTGAEPKAARLMEEPYWATLSGSSTGPQRILCRQYVPFTEPSCTWTAWNARRRLQVVALELHVASAFNEG